MTCSVKIKTPTKRPLLMGGILRGVVWIDVHEAVYRGWPSLYSRPLYRIKITPKVRP
jgi:hypothetical protein